MKTTLRSLAFLFLLSMSSAFAGTTYYSMVLQPEQQATVFLRFGEVLTVTSFTSNGSTASEGAPGTVTADVVTPSLGNDGGPTNNEATVLLSYDPSNVNDQPHTVTIAGVLSIHQSQMHVQITSSTTVATFITYSVTSE